MSPAFAPSVRFGPLWTTLFLPNPQKSLNVISHIRPTSNNAALGPSWTPLITALKTVGEQREMRTAAPAPAREAETQQPRPSLSRLPVSPTSCGSRSSQGGIRTQKHAAAPPPCLRGGGGGGRMFQDPRWMPQTADSTKLYTYYAFSYTYMPVIKFIL